MRRFLLLFATAATLAALGGAGSARATIGLAQAHPAFVPHQVVVKFRGQRSGKAIAVAPGAGVLETAAALRRNPRVAYAEPNYIATASVRKAANPFAIPDDPGSLNGGSESALAPGGWVFKQWNFLPSAGVATPELPTSPGGIDAVAAWRHLAEAGVPGGAGTLVAVLDTGVAYRSVGDFRRSPDFVGNGKFVSAIDFVQRDNLPLDENGHGTHVAGTIAETTGNGIGLTGLAYRARIMPVRVLDRGGRGNAVEIAKGIEFAASHNADLINMSFNFECGDQVPIVDQALARAHSRGVMLVASAGNLDAEACVSEPATAPFVLGVGGTTEGGCLGDYSPSGPAIDVVAPGGGEPAPDCPSILSRPIFQVTLQHGSTSEFAIPPDFTGTSMAAAHVSGVATMLLALEKQAGRRLGPGAVRRVTKRLLRTARSIGLPRTQQGAGLVDAGRATAYAAASPRRG